jgi:integrase
MATIRKRTWRTKGGERTAWICDYADQDGTRRLKTFQTRKEADRWLVTARHQVATGTHTPEATSSTIGEALELWLQRGAAEGLEPATVDQYRQHRAHILAVIGADTKLAKITTARCEQVRDDLMARHSRPMARKVLASFKSVLRDAKRRGLVAANIAAETTIGGGGRHKRKLEVGVDVPTPAEVKALLAAANPKARALVALAALAGLRASELRGLRWADVALGQKPAVTVAQRADRRSVLGSPKSASSRRTVPLGETAARALKEWRLAQPPGRTLVFGTASDKPDMLGNLQRRLLSPLCAAAGTPSYGWHALRHYAISTWLASGIDLKTAQHWAGHATLALTLDTYGHLIPRADDHARIAAAEALLAT